ncbi:glycosyltransferase [bacterium]|nr:MAG: glycosyltransferase [bacterium]
MEKLKILLVSHNHITNYAGAGKVYYELKEKYEAAGYFVDKVDITDLYPQPQRLFGRIFGRFFTQKIFEYLKENAHNYHIIDANLTNITKSKESFGFKGLLIARSQGIMPLYERSYQIKRFAETSEFTRKKKPIRNFLGKYIRKIFKDFTLKDFHASVKYADVIHCLNRSEFDYFLEIGISKDKLVLIPNGLSKSHLNKFEQTSYNRKNNSKIVSIIGAWHNVKGSKDWNDIAVKLIEDKEFDSILILGTVMSEEFVKKDFQSNIYPYLNIIPRYDPSNLPNLLETVKVAVSSSYMEGLPYAVLEQLAAGIPVVGYNVPGVYDFLIQIDKTLLITPGNITELVKKINEILNFSNEDYEKLSKKCIEVSKRYVLENIYPVFLNLYEKEYSNINSKKYYEN